MISESPGVWCGVDGGSGAVMSVLAGEVGFFGIPPVTSQVADAAEGVVALSRVLVHVVSLLRSLADVAPIEPSLQGPLHPAAEVGQRMAQQPCLLVLDGLREVPSIWCDDRGAAKLGLDVDAAEGLEVHGRCEQAGEAAKECAAVGTMYR